LRATRADPDIDTDEMLIRINIRVMERGNTGW
jgi:hypothetical protein